MTGGGAARLFVALDLPEEVVEALVAWRARLLREHDVLRPVRPQALHATLCFLGRLDERAIEPLGALVAAVAGEAGAAPRLALGEPLWLPRRRPRVLALALRDASGALGRLQATLAARLAGDGWYEPEARPYLPHVTVARVRGEAAAPPRRAAPPAVPALAFAGRALTLYRSHPHPSGSRYEALSRNPLG